MLSGASSLLNWPSSFVGRGELLQLAQFNQLIVDRWESYAKSTFVAYFVEHICVCIMLTFLMPWFQNRSHFALNIVPSLRTVLYILLMPNALFQTLSDTVRPLRLYVSHVYLAHLLNTVHAPRMKPQHRHRM